MTNFLTSQTEADTEKLEENKCLNVNVNDMCMAKEMKNPDREYKQKTDGSD